SDTTAQHNTARIPGPAQKRSRSGPTRLSCSIFFSSLTQQVDIPYSCDRLAIGKLCLYLVDVHILLTKFSFIVPVPSLGWIACLKQQFAPPVEHHQLILGDALHEWHEHVIMSTSVSGTGEAWRKGVRNQQPSSVEYLYRGVHLERVRAPEVVVRDKRYVKASLPCIVVGMRRFVFR